MDEADRAALLERVTRQTATVGASLPETVTVGDDELDLAAFIVETRKLDTIPPETEAALTEAKRTLREERAGRLERLESAPLDRETGEALAGEIIGIDRALNALETIRHPTYGEEVATATTGDHKRWLGFLDAIRE